MGLIPLPTGTAVLALLDSARTNLDLWEEDGFNPRSRYLAAFAAHQLRRAIEHLRATDDQET